MNQVGPKIALALVVQVILPWLYIWLCDPGAAATDDRPSVIGTVNSIAAAVGSIVPKSTWYSAYFRDQGALALANEITSVYGFCTLVLALYLATYFCSQLFRSGRPRQMSTEEQLVLLAPGSRDRLSYIENIVLGCGVLTFYYVFFGYGLSQPSITPGESTNGAYVLGGQIFFSAVLSIVAIYYYESRQFLRRTR